VDEALTGGTEWWKEILSQIRESDAVVVAVTERALESVACQAEWQYAIDLHKPIVPLQLEDTSIDLAPASLQQRQWVDYRVADRNSAFALVRALNRAEPSPLPDPLPDPPPLPLTYVAEIRQQLESPAALTLEQQATLLFQLRNRLHAGGDPKAIEQLLLRMRARPDLLAGVDRELEALLRDAQTRAGTPPPKPLLGEDIGPPTPPVVPPTGGGGGGDDGDASPDRRDGGEGPAWLRPPRVYAIAGALVLVVAALLIIAASLGGDGDGGASGGGTSSTAAGTSVVTTSPVVSVTSTASTTSVAESSAVGEETATTAAELGPPCAVGAGERCIAIDAIRKEGDAFVISWTPYGFDPSESEFHAHFFLNDINPAQAGNNAADFGFVPGSWELTAARPYSTSTLAGKASGGGPKVHVPGRGLVPGICVTVGTAPSHNVLNPNRYDCVAMPQ
jgi:hypothetical protein